MASNFLDSIRGLDEISPILICGAARSGTRMMTDLLNEHPQIAIQEEMHAKTIEKYFALLDDIDEIFNHYSERKGRRLDSSWNSTKHVLTHAFLACANKKKAVGQSKDLLFHGIKTPGYERYLPEFEKAFEKTPPYYIYCIRSVDKVWRSWKSMGYLNDIGVFRTRYQRSLRQAIKMKSSVGDRFVLFHLDEFIAAENKSKFIYEAIFSKLGFTEKEGLIESMQFLPHRNSIQNRGSQYVEDSELEDEMQLLMGCSKIIEYRGILNK
jgi:hypothetical protein